MVVIDDIACVRGVGVRGVSGDDFAIKVADLVEERPERQIFGGPVRDLGLGDHCTVVMEQPGEQFDLRSAGAPARPFQSPRWGFSP